LGSNAGISVSGNENIEIIASGSNSSFLTHQASGKINVGNTIVGDIYKGRVTVGSPENVNPSATLYVKPKFASDAAFIIQHQGSGSNSPYFQLQSGDGTTFYQITNSGSVITSGYMAPSGGIFLPHNNKPMLNSGVGGYMLWNDGGSLTWNGGAVGGAGSYANWNLTDGKVSPDPILDGQIVTVSGVSGVEVQYDPSNNFLRISASGLSGVLQSQIIAQTYNFFTLASGNGFGNNVPDLRSAGSRLVISGVSGINIDYRDLDDGTNSSGVFVIGYDNNNTYTFNVTNGKFANDPILNTETVTISGISGVSAEYSPSTNTFTIGASGLSGVLFNTIQNSGNFLRGQILQNTASGLAISGIAAFASGQIVGFTALSAASGLVSENSKVILDPDGSGSIRQLNFPSGTIVIDSFALNRLSPSFRNVNTGPGSILIGSGAGFGGTVVAGATVINIGKGAGQLVFGTPAGGSVSNSIAIGTFAGAISGNATVSGINSISIGERSSAQGQDSISIGAFAGRQQYGLDDSVSGNINIGKNAGAGGTVRGTGNVNIGIEASSGVSFHSNNVSIGRQAAYSSSSINGTVSIGYQSSYDSASSTDCVAIGANSNYDSYSLSRTISIGASAGVSSTGCNYDIMIGYLAGYSSSNGTQNISIGDSTAYLSKNCTRCLFMGIAAGYESDGMKNAISIQTREPVGFGNANKRDFSWIQKTNLGAVIGDQYAIDINNGVQGFMPHAGATLHIGRKLDDFGTAGAATIKSADIKSSALNLTPPTETKSALKLWLCPQTTALSNQSKNLFETQYRSVGASTAPYAVANPIINQYGMLRLPIARSISAHDAAEQRELIDYTGNIIPKGDGVVIMFQGGIGVGSLGYIGTGLAICLKLAGQATHTWFRTGFTFETPMQAGYADQ
jgi:hypothetical protein